MIMHISTFCQQSRVSCGRFFSAIYAIEFLSGFLRDLKERRDKRDSRNKRDKKY
jgi:hypothetical protein